MLKAKRAKLGWIIGIAIWLIAGVVIYYSVQPKVTESVNSQEVID